MATYAKFRTTPMRARPLLTTCDQPIPFPFLTSPHSRAALSLQYRRVSNRRGPIFDSSFPAKACAIPTIGCLLVFFGSLLIFFVTYTPICYLNNNYIGLYDDGLPLRTEHPPRTCTRARPLPLCQLGLARSCSVTCTHSVNSLLLGDARRRARSSRGPHHG
ncbi:hypothetical protein EDB86DRAFT_3245511 [Lactarius hatsudake]|nr:hypothetical protein EDB86DRAFT_3245511 [Lactarius hatsudake]